MPLSSTIITKALTTPPKDFPTNNINVNPILTSSPIYYKQEQLQ